jgi:DNA polymerase III subunit delta'
MQDEIQSPAPEANGRLIGQEAAETGFLRSFASGRTAHAWLLTGPKGVGKATKPNRARG